MSSTLQPTQDAPEFKAKAVVNGAFRDVSLSDYRGKYVVLFFYPLDFTFVCPTEIIAFSDRAEEFRKINCEVLACSTDSHFSHLAWINTPQNKGGLGPMDIPLLADKNLEISRAYGVLKVCAHRFCIECRDGDDFFVRRTKASPSAAFSSLMAKASSARSP